MVIEYNADVTAPPKHLDEPFFTEVLENALRVADAQIDRVHFTVGSATGENYCSQIFRAQINYRFLQKPDAVQRLSVIIKSMPITKATEFLLDLQVFLKERIFYTDVLPRLEMLLDGNKKFGARLYHSMRSPVHTLIFEDLSAKNFEMASRESGLDEAHSRLVMRRLAKLHATSMVLGKKEPELLTCFDSGLLAPAGLDRTDGMILRHFGAMCDALTDRVRQWPGYESIVPKLMKYRANIRANLEAAQKPRSDELKVLNHGDVWVNNMLFKYDKERNLQDLIFVDFQLCVWSSPGIDLNYFFYTSLQLDVLKHKCGALIEEYHRALCAALKELNFEDVPSLEEIQKEVRRRQAYAFFAHYCIFPIVCQDKDKSADSNIENFNDEEFSRNKCRQMFSSPRLQETMRYTLKQFEEMGVWD